MKICVVIPVNNEALTIGRVVKALKEKGVFVLVIDDGSTDGSGGIAKKQGAVVIRKEQRNGKGFSLREGFKYALTEGFDGVITMDGDGQHAAEDLDKFLEEAKKNPVSVVTGNRMAEHKGMPLVRYLTNRFMSGLISWACKQPVPDTQCGYRYISCEILKQVELTSRDFEIETEILIQASRRGYKVISVPVQTIYGREESKIRPVKDTIRFLNYFFKAIRAK